MTSKPKITITDVAQAAGVSVGTVSRVLNNRPDVNASIRDKVLQTAAKLGYQRIRQRKAETGVSQASSHLGGAGDIGIVFFGMEDTLVQLPIISSALQGIESRLSTLGRSLLLANIPGGNRVPAFITENRVRGLILKGPNQGLLPDPARMPLLRSALTMPHIWLMGRLPGVSGDHANFDTDAAARLAAAHLAARGHRRVAFLNPKPGQNQFERLKSSFESAAARLQLSHTLLESEPHAQQAWPLPATTSQGSVAELCIRWMNTPVASRPTALFIPSDRTAVQLYAACKQLGLRIGVDISVVSCNNERALTGILHPDLTTVDVHADVIGQRSVDQLLWRIANPRDTHPVQVLVEPNLVERNSVAQL